MTASRVAFFGLRTNVGYFASHAGFAKLDLRLKAAAVLYDTVLLEGGLYESTITDRGVVDHVSSALSEDQLKPLRTHRGREASWRLAPADEPEKAIQFSGAIQKRYRSQFMTAHVQITAARLADSVRLVSLADVDTSARTLAEDWDRQEHDLVIDTTTGLPNWQKEKIHQNLNLDLARASIMRVELLPDGTAAPAIEAKLARATLQTQASGLRSLRLLLPDLRKATWDDVREIREDAGIRDLRVRLVEFDGSSSDDLRLRERLEWELLRELEVRRAGWRAGVISLALIAASAIPFVGPVLEGISAGKSVADAARDEHRWHATLMRARRRLGELTG
jgi:hypothetical protein